LAEDRFAEIHLGGQFTETCRPAQALGQIVLGLADPPQFSVTWEGSRIMRLWLLIARVMPWRIHQ